MHRQLVKLIFCGSLATLGIVGCSGQQQSEDDLEISDDQQSSNNVGDDDAAEGNGQENFVDNEQSGNNEGAEQGADANSDTEAKEDSDTETVNATLDNTGAPPANDPGLNPAPTNPAMTEPAPGPATAPAAAPPAGGSAPVAGGRVRYVKEGGVQAVSAPGGGSPVHSLSQGDHPVTWEENGWLRISNGMYVPVDSMSDKGVARSTAGKAWQ